MCVISRNDLQSEEIVSELVYSFLIPEVEKIRFRQRGLGGFSVSTLTVQLQPSRMFINAKMINDNN